MKKFDLEAAKNGAAVCLRDGTPVKILDFDFNGEILCKAKIPEFENRDTAFCIDNSGKSIWPIDLKIGKSDKLKVFMAPVYGYACIYKDIMTSVLSTNYIHETYEEARRNMTTGPDEEFFCIARLEMFFEKEGGEE